VKTNLAVLQDILSVKLDSPANDPCWLTHGLNAHRLAVLFTRMSFTPSMHAINSLEELLTEFAGLAADADSALHVLVPASFTHFTRAFATSWDVGMQGAKGPVQNHCRLWSGGQGLLALRPTFLRASSLSCSGT
jgi:hypothetical protein